MSEKKYRTIRINTTTYQKIKILAIKRDVTMIQQLDDLVEELLLKRRKK